MIYKISKPDKKIYGSIHLTASKSESNRILLIQALCKDKFEIHNLAAAQDTQTLKEILDKEASENILEATYDIGAAGTTMRFLTAYFATKSGTRILTGTDRMKKRPIKILVNALRELGADIEYLEEEGYPPLKIKGKELRGGEVEMDATISSQYVSALLLISPAFFNGLVIRFKGDVVSPSYINMTLRIMEFFGIYGQWQEGSVSVSKQNYSIQFEEMSDYTIESDWSAASYWYAMVALAEEAELTITGLKQGSLQGDAVLSDMFYFLGVRTEFIENGIKLTKTGYLPDNFCFDFSDCPDLAQTVAMLAAGIRRPVLLNGLYTLALKETDRIEALINELQKLNVAAREVINASLEISAFGMANVDDLVFNTYDDHRMAMAAVPLALKFPYIKIADPGVVKKSYPAFWDDLKSLGFIIEEE